MYIFYEPGGFFEISFNSSSVKYFDKTRVQKLEFEHYLLDPGIYYGFEHLFIIADGAIKIGTNRTGEPLSNNIIIKEERECGEDILECIRDYMEEPLEVDRRRALPRYIVEYLMNDENYKKLLEVVEEFLREVQRLRGKKIIKNKKTYTALELLSKYNNIR